MNPTDDLFFVYGTLRSDMPAGIKLATGRIATSLMMESGERIGFASIAGQMYDMGSYPACVLSGGGARTRGELWRIIDRDAVFPFLQAYEGSGYRLTPVQVRLETGREYAASTYAWTGDPGALQPIPSGDYLQWLNRPQ